MINYSDFVAKLTLKEASWCIAYNGDFEKFRNAHYVACICHFRFLDLFHRTKNPKVNYIG